MKSRSVLLGAAVIGGVALLARGRAQAAAPPQGSAPSPTLASRPPVPAAPLLDPDEATDDETALARMLASEVNDRKDPSPREARIVIGWLTLKRAERYPKQSLYRFITSGKGYGHQGTGIYASTAQRPTLATRALARELLSGSVVPSAAIRRHVPGSWVERHQGVSDEKLLLKQAATYPGPDGKILEGFGEGIYGRVAGTRWILYSRDTGPITQVPYDSASARLDALPVVPALDKAIA